MSNRTIQEKYDSYDIESLASMIVHLDEEIQEKIKSKNELLYVIQKRLEENKAKEYPSEYFEIKLDIKSGGYDYYRLDKLKAYLKENFKEDLLDKAYTPEHEETIKVNASWDGRVLKGWYKFGGRIKELLEEAQLPDITKGAIVKHKKDKKQE